MTYDLVALGLNAVDVLIKLPVQVKKDDKQMNDSLVIQGGAPTASGASGVARLGYQVAYVARLGDNTLSAIALEEFRNNNVRTELIVQDENSRPALALVEIDPITSGRTVFIQMSHYGFLRPEDIPLSAIKESKILLVDSYDLDATERALKAAQGTSCKTVLDFESGDIPRVRSLLALGTDPILPLGAAQKLTGRNEPEAVLKALTEYTKGQVVITDGKNGSWAWEGSKTAILHQPMLPADTIDTTGCGDAFHAGYTVGLLEGWSLARRMEFGSLLAARVSTRIGGRTALPARKDLPSMINSHVSPELSALLTTLSRKS